MNEKLEILVRSSKESAGYQAARSAAQEMVPSILATVANLKGKGPHDRYARPAAKQCLLGDPVWKREKKIIAPNGYGKEELFPQQTDEPRISYWEDGVVLLALLDLKAFAEALRANQKDDYHDKLEVLSLHRSQLLDWIHSEIWQPASVGFGAQPLMSESDWASFYARITAIPWDVEPAGQEGEAGEAQTRSASREWISLKQQAAKALGMTVRTIERKCSAGVLPKVPRSRGGFGIPVEEIRNLLTAKNRDKRSKNSATK